MSSTKSPSSTAARKPEFTLLYAHQAKPKARHLDKRCWSSVEYREATADELTALPVCKHCERRAERDAQPTEKPKSQPIRRKAGTATKPAQKVQAV
jgi:hypothetical protein